MHWITVAAGLLTIIGLRTRTSSAVFAIGYLILVTHRWSYGASMTIGPIKPVDTLNSIFFLILPFGPSGMRLSVDSWIAKRRSQREQNQPETNVASWQLKLMGIIIAMVYFNAGWSKLTHGGLEWLNGYTVRNMNFQRGIMLDLPLPVWISQHYYLCVMISFLIIGLDLCFVTGLIWRRTLPFWLVSATAFHLITFWIYLNHYHFLSWIVLYIVYIDFEKSHLPSRLSSHWGYGRDHRRSHRGE